MKIKNMYSLLVLILFFEHFFFDITGGFHDKLYKAVEIILQSHKNPYLFYDQRWTIKIFAWSRSVSHTL